MKRLLAATFSLLVTGGACGLANGAGLVGHLLYEDEVAICRYCAEQGEVCTDLDNGEWGCAPFSALGGCSAAADLFFEHEEEGPYLTHVRGKKALEDGFRADCSEGLNPFVANVLVYDFEYDTSLMSDWSIIDDGPDRADQVALTDVDQAPHKPTLWDVQSYPSNDGNDVAYLAEIVFCMSIVLDEPVALQITDKAGHHSNAICLDPVD